MKNNIYKNFFPVIVLNLVSTIVAFFVPALIIKTYGPEYHGLISTIYSVTTYLMLVEAGISAAAIQSLYRPLSIQNYKEINGTLNAINIFYKKIGVFFFILVVVSSVILPIFLSDTFSYLIVFSLTIVTGLSYTLEYFFYSKYKVLLQADNKLYILNWINVLAILLQGSIRIILIMNEQNIIYIQAVPACIYIIKFVLVKKYILNNYTYLDNSIKPEMNALSKKWSVLVHQITNLIVNNTDTLILATVVGMNTVSQYSIYIMIINTVNLFLMQVLSHPIASKIGHLMIQSRDKFEEYYKKYEFIYYYIVTWFFSILALIFLPFIYLYTKNVNGLNYVDNKLMILFIIIGMLANYRVPQLTLINAKGDFKETRNQAIIEALINLFLSIILVNYYGIYGVLIGTIFSFSYRLIKMINYTCKKILNTSIKFTYLKILQSVFLTSIIIILGKNFEFDKLSNNWIEFFINSLIVIVFVTTLQCICYLVLNIQFLKRIIYKN